MHASNKNTHRKTLLLVVLVCLAPVIASYLSYYVFKPAGGVVNYGKLIEPAQPIPPSLVVQTENGDATPLQTLKGKWLLLAIDASACPENCVKKLYFMRQVRVAQGIERERVETVWLRTDSAPVSPVVQQAYPEMRFLSANAMALAKWLPVEGGMQLTDYIYLVDPNGHLIMRFPPDPNPGKIKKDLSKLLKWSSIG
ncbi:MAG: Cytochrome oxidase Cu insertion factor, SCO1/SenC/PrrC family [Glomeribacter sp. 1016415]|nr:Cytochrome oxidase Cu insertion factor, SCO1/SenC/PrrC family [Glomeribacter sp. 1016415]